MGKYDNGDNEAILNGRRSRPPFRPYSNPRLSATRCRAPISAATISRCHWAANSVSRWRFYAHQKMVQIPEPPPKRLRGTQTIGRLKQKAKELTRHHWTQGATAKRRPRERQLYFQTATRPDIRLRCERGGESSKPLELSSARFDGSD